MDSPAPPPPSSSNLWKAWTALVVGTPLLTIITMVLGDHINDGNVLIGIVAILVIICLIVHVAISIRLAKCILAKRSIQPVDNTGAMIGLLAGLIFGGWGVMIAVFFCGCLVAVMTQ